MSAANVPLPSPVAGRPGLPVVPPVVPLPGRQADTVRFDFSFPLVNSQGHVSLVSDSAPVQGSTKFLNSGSVYSALLQKANVSHVHPVSDVTGLSAALDGKAPLSHVHAQSDVTGLAASLSAKADRAASPVSGNLASLTAQGNLADSGIASDKVVHVYSAPTQYSDGYVPVYNKNLGKARWSSVSDKNAVHYTNDQGKTDAEKTKARNNIGAAAASHSHATSDVTGLDAALSGKAPASDLLAVSASLVSHRTDLMVHVPSGGTDGQVLTKDSTQASGTKWTAASGGDANAVHYAADDGKSDAQKAQARTNIGAASSADLSGKVSKAGDTISGDLYINGELCSEDCVVSPNIACGSGWEGFSVHRQGESGYQNLPAYVSSCLTAKQDKLGSSDVDVGPHSVSITNASPTSQFKIIGTYSGASNTFKMAVGYDKGPMLAFTRSKSGEALQDYDYLFPMKSGVVALVTDIRSADGKNDIVLADEGVGRSGDRYRLYVMDGELRIDRIVT